MGVIHRIIYTVKNRIFIYETMLSEIKICFRTNDVMLRINMFKVKGYVSLTQGKIGL